MFKYLTAGMAALCVALALSLWYLNKQNATLRAGIEREVGACNADKLQLELDRKDLAYAQAVENFRAYNRRNESRIEALTESLGIAEDARVSAVEERVARETIIARLEMEAETDEIPDSFACLSAFVPQCVIDGMHGSTGPRASCSVARTGRMPKGSALLANPGALDGTDPAFAVFSDITFLDAFRIAGRNTDSIHELNGRLKAIESLGGSEIREENAE